MKYDIHDDFSIMAQAMGVSASHFARSASIAPSTVSRFLKDYTDIHLSTLDQLFCVAYNYPPHPVRLNQIKAQLATDMFGNILFHGTPKEIDFPIDLNHSRHANDLGPGFYLSESYETAASYVCSYRYPFVYGFQTKDADDLVIKRYDVSLEWMLLVGHYRGELRDYDSCPVLNRIIHEVEGADIIIAPIADNQMYRIISRFTLGEITDDQAMLALSASYLGKQHVYRTKKALAAIDCVERFFLCTLEREGLNKARSEKKRISKDKADLCLKQARRQGRYIEEILG
ncbi:MAG: DUF3990 domain-containing protein [Erysipelotrichaceae bacterium]|nr:DUF3990 domain-containing protein [Erysipelotrichaceae bacterium]